MPRAYRLDDLRRRCQRRIDMETDPSISPAEWNALISEMYGELYSVVEESGMQFVQSTYAFEADGSSSYPLPTDHLATIRLDRLDANGGRTEMDELMPAEQNRYAGQTGEANSFAIIAQEIILAPKPSTGDYELIYLPQAPDLSTATDSTSVDLVQADGEALLINGVAVKAGLKREADVRGYAAEREAARGRFSWWCTQRAFSQPRRPVTKRSRNQVITAGDYTDSPGGFGEVPPL